MSHPVSGSSSLNISSRPSVVHDPKSGTAVTFNEIAAKLAAIISVNTYKNRQPELVAGS